MIHFWTHLCVAPLFISNHGQKLRHTLYEAAILLHSLHCHFVTQSALTFCYTVCAQLSAHFTEICYLTTFHSPTLNDVTTLCNTSDDVTTDPKITQNMDVVNINDTTFIQNFMRIGQFVQHWKHDHWHAWREAAWSTHKPAYFLLNL
jgi:hypothetical protein